MIATPAPAMTLRSTTPRTKLLSTDPAFRALETQLHATERSSNDDAGHTPLYASLYRLTKGGIHSLMSEEASGIRYVRGTHQVKPQGPVLSSGPPNAVFRRRGSSDGTRNDVGPVSALVELP